MVTAVTNLGRSGLSDWLIQRFTAVLMAAYGIFIVGVLVANPEMDYQQWSAIFSQLWVRIFSMATVLAIVAHGWIGLWGVLTDYVTERMMGPKATIMRVMAMGLYALVTISYLIWGIEVLWGVN